MNLVIAVDNCILSFFTKISHKFYSLTGLTNFFLAKLSVCILTLSSMTVILGFWFPVLTFKPIPIVVVLNAIVCTVVLLDMYLCDKADKNIFSGNRVNFFGPISISPVFRFLWLVMVTINIPWLINYIFFERKGILIFNILSRLFALAGTSFFYFIAVDPPSPGKSKVQEWIESFSASFRKLVPIKVSN